MEPIYPTGSAFQSFYQNRQTHEQKLKNANIKTDKKLKKIVLGAALTGAILPVLALNLRKGRGGKMIQTLKNREAGFVDKFNSVRDLFETESFGEMLSSTAGTIGLALTAGLIADKNPENRDAKIKEGTFELLNNMVPTCLAAIAKNIADKTGFAAKGLAKSLRIATTVSVGMFIANKTANKLNKDVFDKGKDHYTKRDFKPIDYLVHIDDLVGIVVVEKSPIARAIQLDKILPLLYARTAYGAGMAKKSED